MYKVLIDFLHQEIDDLLSKKVITKNHNIYVFGLCDASTEIIKKIQHENINVKGILENNAKKQGKFCRGVLSSSVKNIISKYTSKDIFLIWSSYWREMKKQLIAEGVKEEQIIVLSPNNELLGDFWIRCKILYKGWALYRNIKNKYPQHKILLCPYTGTGDVYLIGTLLPAYLKKEKIFDYVLVVVSSACQKVTKIFNIKNVEQINGIDECIQLIHYYMTCPDECDMKILNDSWGEVHTNGIEWIRGYKGMNFTEMFLRYVFQLPLDTKPLQPNLDYNNSELLDFIEKYNIKKGKSVIISPYATTLADIPESFWEELVKKIKALGYDCYTNCDIKTENPIKGSKDIFFPLNIAPQFIEYAGAFIGVRSGFCDVISSAKAKKVVLYDKDNFFYNMRSYEYFNLKDMNLCYEAYELELNCNYDDINKIITFIRNGVKENG